MARVPYDPVPDTAAPGPQGGYENIQANPSEFGGLQAQATQRLGATGEEAGSALGAQAVDWQQRYNQLAVQQGYNNLEKSYINLTYGDPDNPSKKGIYSLQGADAMNAYKPTKDALDSTRQSILNGMPSDAARLEFDTASRRLQYFTETTVGRHVDEQTKNWGFATETDGAQNDFTRASLNPADTGVLWSSAESARDHLVKAIQNRLGTTLSPDVIQTQVRQADTGTVMSTVDGYLRNNNPAGAKNFLENGMLPPRRGFNDPPGGIAVKAAIDPTQHQALLEKVTTLGDQVDGTSAGVNAFNAVTTHARTPNPAVIQQIRTSAANAGVPSDQALTIAHIETHTGTLPDRAGSQYGGVFQLGADEKASVGLAPGADQMTQADKGTQFVARDYKIASDAVGAPAQGWQTYIVHNQGAGAGPALLKADPNASAVDVLTQAGSKDPIAALSQNGGTPGMTVGQFLKVWQVKYQAAANAIGVSSSGLPMTNNQRMPLTGDQILAGQAAIDNDTTLTTPQARAAAQTAYSHHIQVYNEAIRADSEQAVSDIVGKLHLDPGSVDPVNDIMNNAHLTGPQKDSLWNLQMGMTGSDDVRKYGPGYTKAYSAIFAPDGDPGRIADLNDILKQGAPGGDLTISGVQRLTQIYHESRKSEDEVGIHTTAASLLTYAKNHLSFEEDTGPIKIRDPKGEAIFNAQFVPKFEAALSAWRKAGKDPMTFLTQDNIDKMMQGLRSPTDMARDRLAATGQLAPEDIEKPGAPIPPPPSRDINAGEWYGLMSAPPTAQSGTPYTHAAWAEVLKRLTADPEKAAPFFDQRFGPAGYSAQEILGRLKKPPPMTTMFPGQTEGLQY